MNNITRQEIKQVAEEAYIYAFPMLMGYRYAFATFLRPGCLPIVARSTPSTVKLPHSIIPSRM
jgi:hypothetical protein